MPKVTAAAKPKPKSKKRVRRSPEQARRHILDAAVRVLSEHGPEASGLKEVAAAAGVSHALVTHYFGTYEALVEAAVGEAMAKLRERLLGQIMKLEKPAPDQIAQLYLDIALEPWYGRLLGWTLYGKREPSSEFFERLVPQLKLMAAGTEYLFSDAPGGPPSREQAEALFVTLWALVVGYVAGNRFFWHALGRKPGPARDRSVRDVIGLLSRNVRF